MTESTEKRPLKVRLASFELLADFEHWHREPSMVLNACELTKDDIPELIALMLECVDWFIENNDFSEDDDCDDHACDENHFEMLRALAWRALGCLRAAESVGPLLGIIDALVGEEEEEAIHDFPEVFGLIGKPAWDKLKRFVLDRRHEDEARVCAIDGLKKIAQQSEELRGPLITFLIEVLKKRNRRDERVNSAVLQILIDLKAKEAAETIERAYAANCIDHGLLGDWETVRQGLGVDSLGLPMPKDPFDSVEEFRKYVGISCFSDVPLFIDGQLDEDAFYRYVDTAIEAYSKSSEAVDASNSMDDDIGWIRIFLEYTVIYQGESIRTISAKGAKRILYGIFPQKVSTEAYAAQNIIDALIRFWTFVQREHRYKNAQDVLAVLKDRAVLRLRRELSNPSNFGIAKSLCMMASEEGVDLRNPTEIESFMATLNRRLESQGEFIQSNASYAESDVQVEFLESSVRRCDTASVPQPTMTGEELQKFKRDRHKILSSKKRK